MYKRIVHIVVTGLFFILSTGFSVNLHYCSDSLVDISLTGDIEHCCTDEKCCQSESVDIQYVNEYIPTFNRAKLSSEYQSFNIPFRSKINDFSNQFLLTFPRKFIEPPPEIAHRPELSALQVYLL